MALPKLTGNAIALVISLILIGSVVLISINNSSFPSYAKKGGSHNHQSGNNQTSSNQPSSTATPHNKSNKNNNQTGGSSISPQLISPPPAMPGTPLTSLIKGPPMSFTKLPLANITTDQPPVIVLEPKSQTIIGDADAVIDASKSYDPDGKLMSFNWITKPNFSHGAPSLPGEGTIKSYDIFIYSKTTPTLSASSPSVVLPPDAPCRASDSCNITVQYTLTDNAGLASTESAVINIRSPQAVAQPASTPITSNNTNDKPPVADLEPKSQTVTENTLGFWPLSIDSSKSFDPDGKIVHTHLKYIDNFGPPGDIESVAPPTVRESDNFRAVVPQNASCRSSDTCKVTWDLAVTDNAGLSSTANAVENLKIGKPLISNNNNSTSPKTSLTSSPSSSQTKNNNPSTSSTNLVTSQNTVSSQGGGTTATGISPPPSSFNAAGSTPYTQTPSVSMWSLSLGKSTFPREGLRLLANLKPFTTIGVPYILDISLNLPSGNVSLIAAQITNASVQHAVIIPINKTAEGSAGESLYQAELGQVITGINPFTKQPDTINGGATDLMLLNNGTSDIAFNEDSGATMALAYK